MIMAETGTLHDAFLDELRDAYDAEKQLTKALPRMAKAASSPDLRKAFEVHLEETRGQIERLEQVFDGLDEKVRGKHCDGIAGIIEEGKSVMEEDFDDATMDACLIAGGQRAEHYEMAAYGTLVAWAQGDGPHRRGRSAAGNAGRRESRGREAVVSWPNRESTRKPPHMAHAEEDPHEAITTPVSARTRSSRTAAAVEGLSPLSTPSDRLRAATGRRQTR
jgi:ferritin-like metal-binding protein YciE